MGHIHAGPFTFGPLQHSFRLGVLTPTFFPFCSYGFEQSQTSSNQSCVRHQLISTQMSWSLLCWPRLPGKRPLASYQLCVGNLAPQVSDADLYTAFRSGLGLVVSCMMYVFSTRTKSPGQVFLW